jgi:ubiquinone/menaquinone biosynthesis methyltransferase
MNDSKMLLDVASGTGDIAIKCLKKSDKDLSVTMCDINREMLSIGRERVIDGNILKGVSFIQANAEQLPFLSDSFDAYSVAFGIRNVTDITKALLESYRVLRHGGRFFCLEFSKVENVAIERLYDLYSFNVIPKLGECIVGERESYEYLVESIRNFPDQERFSKMISDAGYQNVSYQNLAFGVATIHTAYKI